MTEKLAAGLEVSPAWLAFGLGPQRWPRRGELRRLRELVAELEGQASPLSTEAAQAIRLAYGLGPAEAAEEESG